MDRMDRDEGEKMEELTIGQGRFINSSYKKRAKCRMIFIGSPR